MQRQRPRMLRERWSDKEPEERQAGDMICEVWLLSEAGRQPGDRAGSQEGARTDGGEGDWDGGGKNSQTVWEEAGGRDGNTATLPILELKEVGEGLRKWGDWGNGQKLEGREIRPWAGDNEPESGEQKPPRMNSARL